MALCAVGGRKHTSFSHHRTSRTSGFPCTTDVTAYSALSPGPTVPVIASNALRLVTRLGDFALVQLQHQPRVPGPHGFAVRLRPRPSCAPVMIAPRTATASAPRSFRDVPAALSVHRDPARASDDGLTPLWRPERPEVYTTRYIASSENLAKPAHQPFRLDASHSER